MKCAICRQKVYEEDYRNAVIEGHEREALCRSCRKVQPVLPSELSEHQKRQINFLIENKHIYRYACHAPEAHEQLKEKYEQV